MARQQLHLIEDPDHLDQRLSARDTRLDERTKAIGRIGLARARAALAAADQRRASRSDRPSAA